MVQEEEEQGGGGGAGAGPLTERQANAEGEGGGGGKGPSRLPVPGPRPKRAADAEENRAPPRQGQQKRPRGGPSLPARKRRAVVLANQAKVPLAAATSTTSTSTTTTTTGPHGRPTSRAALGRVAASSTAMIRKPVVEAATLAAPPKPAGGGRKKRAPWDLKGQLADLQAQMGAYKEKVHRLGGENESLKHRAEGLQQELERVTAHSGELGDRVSTLASELQVWQVQAKESLQQLAAVQAKEEQLEETLQRQAQTIRTLEGVNGEVEEANRALAAQLDAREVALRLAEQGLAQGRQENDALRVRVTEQEQKLHDSEMERRCLHNMVQELKGNIRVFCRVRPLLACEKQAQKGMGHLRFPPEDSKSLVLLKAEESHVGRERREDITYDFTFDRVFPPSSSQEDIFEEIALLVQSALDGYHVCIFAYGQTGSGKTYTMEGPVGGPSDSAGLIPRAVQQVFKASTEMETKGWKYHFTASFLEIYNESLRDLLGLRPDLRSSELEIKRVNHDTEELHVPNLSYVPVTSAQEVLELIQVAQANRSVAKTTLNERSSRSHSLFQLRVEGRNSARDLSTSSVLSLVDLAGSERLDKSLSKGERLKETQAINSSLSNLGLVIMALSNKDAHVPYRNSKLTYLLQNSLGGSSKMLMFVTISPLEENFAESLNSLRFATKVNDCVIGTAQTHRK